jgi:hypothetical protein
MPVSPGEFDNLSSRIDTTLERVESMIDQQLMDGNFPTVTVGNGIVPYHLHDKILTDEFWNRVIKDYFSVGWSDVSVRKESSEFRITFTK